MFTDLLVEGGRSGVDVDDDADALGSRGIERQQDARRRPVADDPLVVVRSCAAGSQEEAAGALWNLAFKNATNKVAIVAAGAVDPLVVMRDAGGRLKEVAAVVLKELDLAAIASQLQTLEKASRKRRREEECVRHCVVCLERAREVAFDPCGHFVCCSECGLRVSTCPLCRGAIEKKLRIYVG